MLSCQRIHVYFNPDQGIQVYENYPWKILLKKSKTPLQIIDSEWLHSF